MRIITAISTLLACNDYCLSDVHASGIQIEIQVAKLPVKGLLQPVNYKTVLRDC
jgi:hypothetical protein